tara:strand:- start:460 stop:726 length:267 start_codon:yes stop_codon:yes gene_type:complete
LQNKSKNDSKNDNLIATFKKVLNEYNLKCYTDDPDVDTDGKEVERINRVPETIEEVKNDGDESSKDIIEMIEETCDEDELLAKLGLGG